MTSSLEEFNVLQLQNVLLLNMCIFLIRGTFLYRDVIVSFYTTTLQISLHNVVQRFAEIIQKRTKHVVLMKGDVENPNSKEYD